MGARTYDPRLQCHWWDRPRGYRRRCWWCRVEQIGHFDRVGLWWSWTWPDGSSGDDRLEGLPPRCPGPATVHDGGNKIAAFADAGRGGS